ncbi:MAG TPA: hypothetical protein VJQ54_15650 [Candidatus Sulfotelmatobacter sp.]|nr:hypothetical protein [Candidatus Sulfotelmatobacter sp.]
MNSRRDILNSLLAFDRPIEELRTTLAEFEWDSSEPLVSLTHEHVLTILRKFLAGVLTADAVEAWADLIELRDDIEFSDDRVLDVIFVLANPMVRWMMGWQSDLFLKFQTRQAE